MGGMGGGGPMGGSGPMGGGGRGGAPINGDGGGPDGAAMPAMEVVVRWESAAPIREAERETAPGDSDAYAIAVIGMRMNMGGRAMPPNDDDMPGRPQPTAQLQIKGKPPLNSTQVNRVENIVGSQHLVFHFDRAELPITATSKEVVFSMHMGPMALTAKFTPRDMIYKGQLSL